MDQKVMFKSVAFGGFDKKAVLDYIYQLNTSLENARQDLGEELERMHEAKRELERELRLAEEKTGWIQGELDAAAGEASAAKERVEELAGVVDNLNGELRRSKELLERQEAELEELNRQNRDLNRRNQDLEGNRSEVEQASSQIGKLLIDAHSDADKILEHARKDAELVLDRARQEAREMELRAAEQLKARREEAERYAREMTESAARELEAAMASFHNLHSEMNGIRDQVLAAASVLQDKATDIDVTMRTAEDRISAACRKTPLEYALEEDEAPGAAVPGEGVQEDFFRSAAES